MSYFNDAEIEFEGRRYRLLAEEMQALESQSNYWHGPGNPSTWLAVAVLFKAREKSRDAPIDVTLELAAQALGITVHALRSAIEWHEQYMRWHDGNPDYRIL